MFARHLAIDIGLPDIADTDSPCPWKSRIIFVSQLSPRFPFQISEAVPVTRHSRSSGAPAGRLRRKPGKLQTHFWGVLIPR
jgi:hypothetical protein